MPSDKRAKEINDIRRDFFFVQAVDFEGLEMFLGHLLKEYVTQEDTKSARKVLDFGNSRITSFRKELGSVRFYFSFLVSRNLSFSSTSRGTGYFEVFLTPQHRNEMLIMDSILITSFNVCFTVGKNDADEYSLDWDASLLADKEVGLLNQLRGLIDVKGVNEKIAQIKSDLSASDLYYSYSSPLYFDEYKSEEGCPRYQESPCMCSDPTN